MAESLNKFLPQLTETTSLSDLDIIYLIEASDYKATLQNTRKTLNPLTQIINLTTNIELTTDDCIGQYYSNKYMSSNVEVTLPDVSDGLMVTFIVQEEYDLVITPQATDQIIHITSSVGESISSDTLNDTIMLRATDNGWYVIKKKGNW
jgi:hypothetical protein